jgi:hypothetical protein
MKYLIKREDEERHYQARYLIKDGVLVMLMTEDLSRLIRCDLCHKNNGCCSHGLGILIDLQAVQHAKRNLSPARFRV